MAVDRRQLLLSGALIIVVALAAWQFWPSAPASTAPAPAADRGRPSAQADVPKPVAPVKIHTLTASRSGPGEAERNPFRFQPKAAPPPPRPSRPPSGEVPFAVPASPAGPPPLPPIGLKLIGVVERANGVKWAVLSDGKSPTPMYGREGEIIDGRYAIVKIGAESIEMTYADGRGRQVIRLTGQ